MTHYQKISSQYTGACKRRSNHVESFDHGKNVGGVVDVVLLGPSSTKELPGLDAPEDCEVQQCHLAR